MRKTLNYIAVVILIVSALMVNEESCVPAVVFASTLAYLCCSMYVGEIEKAKEKKK
jgi:hypothetical protein